MNSHLDTLMFHVPFRLGRQRRASEELDAKEDEHDEVSFAAAPAPCCRPLSRLHPLKLEVTAKNRSKEGKEERKEAMEGRATADCGSTSC